MLSDDVNHKILSTQLEKITQYLLDQDNSEFDFSTTSSLILNRVSSNFYLSMNNRVSRVTNIDDQDSLRSRKRNRRRLSANLGQNGLLGKRDKENSSSSTTPSTKRVPNRHHFLSKGKCNLSKRFRTEPLKAEGNVKYLNSLGHIWGINSRNEFCQFHCSKKTALFKLQGRFSKNPLRIKSTKNKICLLNSNRRIEVMDTRTKKRLIKTPLHDHRSRISISEFHLDSQSLSCYLNFDNFYNMIKFSILERKITKFDLTQGKKGGQLFCRTSFLPTRSNKLIFAHNTSKFTSEKLKFKVDVLNLRNSKAEFTSNYLESEMEGDPNGDVGKLINIDPEAQKFVHVIQDKIKYYQLQENGQLKRLAEHTESDKSRRQILEIVLQTIQN